MQMVLGPDHWLAGKIIVLLNDSDVNKISHSFEKKKKKKRTKHEKKGEKIPIVQKLEPEETVFCSADE